MAKRIIFLMVLVICVACVSRKAHRTLISEMQEAKYDYQKLKQQNDSLLTVSTAHKPVVQIDDLEQVVYRNLDNHLTIRVPNAVSVNVEGKKIRHIKNDSYLYTPRSRQSSIVVHAKFNNGKETHDTVNFVVKDVERWVALVNNRQGRVRMTKKELKEAVFSVKMPDFRYKHKIEIHEFSVLVPGQPGIRVKGNRLNKKAKECIERTELNKEVYILSFNCSLEGVRLGRICKPPTLLIVELVAE